MRLSWSGWLMLVVVLGLCASTASGVKVNIMASVPYGAYLIQRVASPLTRGQLVSVRTAETTRWMRERHGWLAGFWPILKPVAALPGDEVCQVRQELYVLPADLSAEDPILPYGTVHLPQAFPLDGDCLTVPGGFVYLASAEPYSLDSRYFGFVRVSDVAGRAVPLWTLE
jgi:type IV secretory pathway protease TraF